MARDEPEYELLFDVSRQAINRVSIVVAVVVVSYILYSMYTGSIPHTAIHRIPDGRSQMLSIWLTDMINLLYTLIYILALPGIAFLVVLDILDKQRLEEEVGEHE